jgi:hypothetical protein
MAQQVIPGMLGDHADADKAWGHWASMTPSMQTFLTARLAGLVLRSTVETQHHIGDVAALIVEAGSVELELLDLRERVRQLEGLRGAALTGAVRRLLEHLPARDDHDADDGPPTEGET